MSAPSNREIWEQAFAESRLRDEDYSTMSGIPLEPVYGPDDGEFPGQYPYTRGPHASMYRSKPLQVISVSPMTTATSSGCASAIASQSVAQLSLSPSPVMSSPSLALTGCPPR